MAGTPQVLTPEKPILRSRGISKTFGPKRVLKDVDITLLPGEIHGLIGANGSGKSTFIKILAGFHTPDEGGQLEVDSQDVPLPIVADQELPIPIRFVHQDLALWEDGTVAENYSVANHESSWHLNPKREHERVSKAFDRFKIRISPDRLVRNLSAVERSLLAIVRAADGLLGLNRGVLVLDEPTAALGRDKTLPLFDLLRDLRSAGISVVLVSHRLDEILELSDRISVLRDGQMIGTWTNNGIDEDVLIEALLGRRAEWFLSDSVWTEPGPIVFEAQGIESDLVKAMDLELRSGEILGLVGLEGMGHEELPYLLFGAKPLTGGHVRIGEETIGGQQMTPKRAIAAGIALLPAHRIRDSGLLSSTAEENFTLPTLRKLRLLSVIPTARYHRMTVDHMERFAVNPRNSHLELGSFSGGNQQKLLLAKWFKTEPKLLILHEPTQGVDVGAKSQIFELIRQASNDGMAVIIASGESNDLAHLCSRVLVFRDGRICAELSGTSLTNEEIQAQCLVTT